MLTWLNPGTLYGFQDGWILAKFFFACFGPRRSRSPYTRRKKRTRPISSHLDRTDLVNKRFNIWLSGEYFLRDTVGSPERQDSSILPVRGARYIVKYLIVPFYATVISGSFGPAIGILNRLPLAKIRTMVRPKSPDMSRRNVPLR